MNDLTDRQRAVLDFIVAHKAREDWAPTIREICDHFGINSPNGVVCHLDALEKKGYIERRPNSPRAIKVIG
jgi:repressor LexA